MYDHVNDANQSEENGQVSYDLPETFFSFQLVVAVCCVERVYAVWRRAGHAHYLSLFCTCWKFSIPTLWILESNLSAMIITQVFSTSSESVPDALACPVSWSVLATSFLLTEYFWTESFLILGLSLIVDVGVKFSWFANWKHRLVAGIGVDFLEHWSTSFGITVLVFLIRH